MVAGLFLVWAAAGQVCAETAGASERLANGDFAGGLEDGLPAQWTVVPGQKVSVDAEAKPAGGGRALRVDIVQAVAGGSLGEIRQTVRVKPGADYRAEGLLKATRHELAVLGIKLRKDGKEVERLATEWNSGTAWTPVSLAFNVGAADEVQVLCRWRQSQKDKAVGESAWFAGLSLKEAPAPAQAQAGSPAAGGPWADAIRRAASVALPAPVPLPLPAASGDLYLTPDGAGARTGADWANALPGNAAGVLQAAWDALPPGRTCRLGSGLYVNLALKVASGGTSAAAMKRLAGEDTGQGLPWLVGDWDPKSVERGASFLSLGDGVSHCAFEHLRLARYHHVMFSKNGRHAGLRLRDVSGYELRFGVFLCGGGTADNPDVASRDIEIADCSFIHFTKSAVRLQGGNHDVRVLNCTADAGGTAWMKEAFHIAYNLQGDATRDPKRDATPWACERDIVFVNCVARNCIYSQARYWQGDGYCAERGVRNLAFVNCAAFDCADGGWDVKSDNVVFINCVSLRNKMNVRIWGKAYLINSLSANAFKRGGSWTSAGLWSIGTVCAHRVTIANNDATQVYADSKSGSAADIALERCVVAAGAGADGQPAALFSEPARVRRVDCAEWRPASGGGAAVGEDPQLRQPALGTTWVGEPADAFDSARDGGERGYRSSVTLAWRARPVEHTAEFARGLLKHGGWGDLKRRVEAATAELGRNK